MKKKKSVGDNWENVFKGVGVPGLDPRLATRYRQTQRLDEQALSDLYGGNGLARRIVDLPAREMTKAGFDVLGDPDGLVRGYLEEKKLLKPLRTMVKWARLYGGSLGLIGAQDGMQQLWRPLATNRLRSVEFIHVFDRYRVTWTTGDLYADPLNPKYGQPEFYHISPLNGRPFRVHETRVLVMDGMETSEWNRQNNQGWGDSILQNCYENVRAIGMAFTDVEHMLDDFVTNIFKIKGIAQAFMQGNEKAVRERLHSFDYSRHVSNSVILDADGEEFSRVTSALSGVPEIMEKFMAMGSADSGIPQTLLFGRAPQGLQATGESDRGNWQDEVSSLQEDQLQPPLEDLVRLVMLSKDGPFRGREVPNWKIQFRPIGKPSEKELEETRKATAERDRTYIEAGVLMPEEVRASRFGGDRYSTETTLDEGAFADGQARAELEEEAREAAAKAAAAEAQPEPEPVGAE